MTPLLTQLLYNAATAALLATGAWIAGRWIRRPGLSHGLWLIALLRLLVPPLPSLFPKATEPLATWSTAVTSSVAGTLTAAETALGHESAAPDWPHVILAIWVVGALLTLGLGIARSARLGRILRGAADPGPALEGQIRAVAKRVGLTCVPRIRVTDAVIPPMVWALGTRSLLLLPRGLLEDLTAPERDAIVAHELVHVKRGDPWVRLAEFAVAVVFWWYPIAAWIRRELKSTEETICDVTVAASLAPNPRPYADGLIKTLSFLADSRFKSCPASCGVTDLDPIKERLHMIMKPTPFRHLSRQLRWTLAGAALALLLISPGLLAYGADDATSNRPSERAAVQREIGLLEIRVTSSAPLEGYEPFELPDSDEVLYLAPDAVLTEADIRDAALEPAKQATSVKEEPEPPRIAIRFTEQGAETFARLTRDHINEKLAILIEGQLVSAPIVKAEITGGRAIITGDFSREEAERIVKGLLSSKD